MSRPHRVYAYVGLLIALQLPLTLAVFLSTPWHGVLVDPAVLLVLGGLVVVGELRPIMISRGNDTVDIVTISSCFSVALMLHGPLVVALCVQALALAIDDVRCRRSPLKWAFNHANYQFSLLLTRGIYCAMTGRGLLVDDTAFRVHDMLPALVTAICWYVVNQGLTTVVICLAVREPIGRTLRVELASHSSSVGVLLALSPVVVHVVSFSPFLVLLLLLPMVSLHKSAELAVERERQALHDSLTGLPNRALFNERAARAVKARGTGLLAVMLTDLDHFKEINDTLGHHVGDRLLVEVAARIRAAVREEDFVARIGGDEFALVCADLESPAAAQELAGRVVAAMEGAFSVDGVRLDIRASVGIALAPDHGDHAQTLLQRADIALYAAKVQRGTWSTYVPEEDGHSIEKLALLGQLRDGVDRDELVVHYQPLCNAVTGELQSVEARVRWQHPTQGLIFPDRFISIAENTGLIAPLTHVVLHRTLAQLVAWERAGLRVDASVNLSARQLTDLDLPGQVADALARYGLAPDRLVLEVTESHIVSDASRTAVVLRGLRSVGVRIAVDDFGTGYSSLTQLRGLSVDVLKIDRSFVTHMCIDENDALIVRSTIDLGHNLGLRVVAEGVEDDETWQTLADLGCDVVQGYRLSRPLPAADLLIWARARTVQAFPPGPTLEDVPA